MNFTTKIPIQKAINLIDYNSKILSLGSCFAENMADKFSYFKFENSVNPFGILFHPLAIEKIILKAINQEKFTENDIFFHNEQWHCYDVHSDLSHSDSMILLANLNQTLTDFYSQIQNATHIIITYGTAWVYRNKSANELVANCHKVPQNQFDKEILSIETIRESIQNTITSIEKVNPNCAIIFTISPVRHIKDGFVENQRSKAHLIAALHSIFDIRHSTTSYFPSYEIMMDELRDYRFYSEDMLHPTQIAIDYIWERLSETTISKATFSTMEKIASVQKRLAHRPFQPHSESHSKFLENLQKEITELQKQFPFLKF